MMNEYQVIIEPIITEKVTTIKDADRVVCFKVAKNANKKEIKESVEKIFKVEVESVKTINYVGKPKRMGRWFGRRPSWKKAYIKLSPKSKMIDFYEGV